MIKNLYVRHEFLTAVKVAKHWGVRCDFIRLYKHYRRTTNYVITTAVYEAMLDLDLFWALPDNDMSVFNRSALSNLHNLSNKEKTHG